jgi:hypothetical protein
MSNYSTARVIMYDLRPSKQIERKLVFDTIAITSRWDVGDALPFIGMGGFRFVDFIVAHKYLGTRSFISIEHDSGIIKRCEYNKPFNNIEIRNETVHEFLLAGGARKRAIVWLDYECGLTENLLDELQILTGTVGPGSYVFVTCKALPDRSLSGLGPKRVKRFYEDQLGAFASSFGETDYSRKKYSNTAARLLSNMISDGFAGRTDGVFSPYLRLIYNDSNPMATVGGFFGLKDRTEEAATIVARRFPFLQPANTDHIYDVGAFNLTEAERRLFNRAALAPQGESEDSGKLSALGFGQEEVRTYRDLMRYVPHYFEALF